MDCKLYIITPPHLKPARASIYVCGLQLKVSSWTTIWTVSIIFYTGRKCTLKTTRKRYVYSLHQLFIFFEFAVDETALVFGLFAHTKESASILKSLVTGYGGL